MSGLLWGAIVFAIFGSVASIVIAIIGTIEDQKRRFTVTVTIGSIAIVTLLACLLFIHLHKVREAPDAVVPVETERISKARDRDVLR